MLCTDELLPAPCCGLIRWVELTVVQVVLQGTPLPGGILPACMGMCCRPPTGVQSVSQSVSLTAQATHRCLEPSAFGAWQGQLCSSSSSLPGGPILRQHLWAKGARHLPGAVRTGEGGINCCTLMSRPKAQL